MGIVQVALGIDAVNFPDFFGLQFPDLMPFLPGRHIPVVDHLMYPVVIAVIDPLYHFVTLAKPIPIVVVHEIIITIVMMPVLPVVTIMVSINVVIGLVPVTMIILRKSSRKKQGAKQDCKNFFHKVYFIPET